MKKLPYLVLALLLLQVTAASAQITANVTKSQEDIISDFNRRANIDLKIFPNPASNYLIIEPELQSEGAEIKIMDITGRTKNQFHLEPGTNGVTVDISEYMNGLYILALYDSSNQLVHVKRFNKN